MTEQQPPTTEASGIEERMRADLRDALRARDQVRMDTIRMALTAFNNEEVARSRKALTDADRVAVLDKQVKQRDESAAVFRENNRPELAEKEAREAEILRVYMPARLPDDELRELIGRLVAANGQDFRKVMPLASRETKGRADGRRVQEIVRELTAQ